MIGLVVIVVVVLLLGAAAVLYARRVSTGRVTHRRASTGLELRRGTVSFPVPPAALADGPVSMHLEVPVEARRVDVGPPPGVDDRRRRDVGPAGRHRRDEAGPDAVTMTGFMQQLTAEAIARDARMQAAVDAETGRIPRVQP